MIYGKNSLIALDVVGSGGAMEVGREGRGAVFFGECEKILIGRNESDSIAEKLLHGNGGVAKRELLASRELAAIEDAMGVPISGRGVLFEEDKFALSAGGVFGEEARFDDFCIVEN